MKKTLIAMAAAATLATSGAAFAQATITGFMAAGYGTLTTGGATTSTTGGLGVDTAEMYITASEDLGGGMKAGGKMGIGGMERAGWTTTNTTGAAYAVYGHNFTMYVENAMGKLTVGSTKPGDYISAGLASSGVMYYDFGDYGNFGGRSRRDSLTAETTVGPIALALVHFEAGNQVGEFNGAEGASGQRINVISGTYAAGALKVNAQYLAWDNKLTGNTSADQTYRLSGNYNLGVATVGAGVQRVTYDSGAAASNYGLSAAVPMGALSVGVMVGSRITDGFAAAAANGTQSSYSLNASYALSKRTGVTGQYNNWDASVAPAYKSSMALLLLTHSF
ncbi:MAG: porin [Comamonadaceae bacterium]